LKDEIRDLLFVSEEDEEKTLKAETELKEREAEIVSLKDEIRSGTVRTKEESLISDDELLRLRKECSDALHANDQLLEKLEANAASNEDLEPQEVPNGVENNALAEKLARSEMKLKEAESNLAEMNAQVYRMEPRLMAMMKHISS